MKKCTECGANHERSRGAKTCSPECAVARSERLRHERYSRQRAGRKCEVCGISIEHKRKQARFCSVECRRVGPKVVAKDCQYCGEPITGRGRTALFCSDEHMYLSTRERMRATKTRRGCVWCSADISEMNPKARACNQEHYRLWFSREEAAYYNMQGLKRRSRISSHIGVSSADFKRLLARYNHSCAYCGSKPESIHIDHIIPIKLGGEHRIGNILPACPSCNLQKGAMLLSEFKRRNNVSVIR